MLLPSILSITKSECEVTHSLLSKSPFAVIMICLEGVLVFIWSRLYSQIDFVV